jgi:hypothetical protein
MKKQTVVLAVASVSYVLSGFVAPAFSETINIAAGKPVAASGEFFTGGWGEGLTTDFSTLTDGNYFKNGQQWDQGTVWWDQSNISADIDQQPFLQVFLGHTYYVRKIAIQADANDDYLISWDDARPEYEDTNPQQVVIVPKDRIWGMGQPIVKKINAVTDSFKIEHYSEGAGDGLYSISEFQAAGYKVHLKKKKKK